MDGMEELKAATEKTAAPASAPIERKPILDSKGRAYATGKRKTAIAKVWLQHGKGNIIVNDKKFEEYFTMEAHRAVAITPFKVTNTVGTYDICVTVLGGGISAQAGALRHGISRALCNMDPGFRTALKIEGLLTRDRRSVERKKYGKKKARKSFQFSKR